MPYKAQVSDLHLDCVINVSYLNIYRQKLFQI